MKWIIVALVNFLPATGQWEMQDYRNYPFDSKAACEAYMKDNKRALIRDINYAYSQSKDDYYFGCVTVKEFYRDIWHEDINPLPGENT